MKFKNAQLEMSEKELNRLGARVNLDYRNALSDHSRRIQRYAEYMERWRTIVTPPAQGDESLSNYPVPLIKWAVANKLSKEMDSLFGEDAQIVAEPVGASDYKRDKKISLYMTWRVFNSMKLKNAFYEFVFKKLMYGRAIAYSPWKRKTMKFKRKDVVVYEGPDFLPLEADDFVVPAEDARSLHDFSFVIRKYRAKVAELLIGEEEGRYQGITDNLERLTAVAYRRNQRESEGDEVKQTQDDAEGVQRYGALSSPNTLLVLEWYGKWHMLLSDKDDASEENYRKRELDETDLLVRYNPETNLVLGIQELSALYPTLEYKRPFVESSRAKDGSYWCEGLPEELINAEDEVRSIHNKGMDGFDLAIAPPVFYRPGMGFEPEHFRLQAGEMVPCDDPSSIKQLQIAPPLELAQAAKQEIYSDVEKSTGLSDLTLGRTPDRPNAPKTASGTGMLIQEGNVRLNLDATVLREDMSEILKHFWEMEAAFSPKEMFFRVTEDDAGGLFDVADGGSMITAEDRDGRYDFKLEFAGSYYSKEMDKQRTLARYQVDIQNPLIASNPAALWEVTRQVHEALGDPDFDKVIPKPAPPDIPVDPKNEWTSILQGEEVHVNPMDNDQVHMVRHMKDMTDAVADPNHDPEALQELRRHYLDHVQQLREKQVIQAMSEMAVQAAQQAQAAAGVPLGFPPPPTPGPQMALASNFPPGAQGVGAGPAAATPPPPAPPQGAPAPMQ